MFPSLKDKLVLVTGGERGIGKAIAQKFIEAGAKVAIAGIDVEKGKKTAVELGERAMFYYADVSKEEDVKRLVEEVKEKQGYVDILVNNAGIHMEGNLETGSYKDWRNVLSVNLDGVFLVSKYFLTEHMKPRKRGVIINIGSEAGIVAFKNQVAYNVSKAAVIHLTRSIAIDHAKDGIRANAVCPGTTYTPLVEKILERAENPEEVRKYWESLRPLGRLGRPEEIAYAVLCMAADELGYATGAVLCIDGGSTAQ